MTDDDRVTLKEYVNVLFREHARSITLAKADVDRRLGEMNELRKQIDSERGSLASADALENVRSSLEGIRRDHVTRREFDAVGEQIGEARGARRSMVVSATVIVSLFVVAWGAMWSNQVTHDEVKEQVQTEAPWVKDEPKIESRLNLLERRQSVVLSRLSAIEALERSERVSP